MRTNRVRYILAILAACLLVVSCMVVPGFLLRKADARIIDKYDLIKSSQNPSGDLPHTTNQGDSPQTESPAASPTGQSLNQLTDKVRIFERNSSKSTLSSGSASGSMSMKDAVDTSIERISSLLKVKALLPLIGFPNAYSVNAELREATDSQGAALQFWSITFTVDSALSSIKQQISVALDAQTSLFYSIEETIGNGEATVDLESTAKVIAQAMNISGKLVSSNQTKTSQKALWAFDESKLTLQMSLSKRSILTGLKINMGVDEAPAPAPQSTAALAPASAAD